MRLSKAKDEQLTKMADDYRYEGRLVLASCIEQLIDRRADEASELRQMESSFAYECASGAIESSCRSVDGDLDCYDLSTQEADISEELTYLRARGLIQQHETNPNWIHILDESEATA